MLDLRLDFSDINSFTDLLNTSDAWSEILANVQTEDVFYNACEKHLISQINRVRVVRCFTARGFYADLRKCLKDPVAVKIHPFKRGYAYMLDRGEVHIMADLLFMVPQSGFIAVLLHETAHIVLRQMRSYDQLLKLDALFAQQYLKGRHDSVLKTITPVEFFAQHLANQWMRKLSELTHDRRLKDSLLKEIDTMHNKLSEAVKKLSKTNN